jgi:hypothetical protein
LQSKETTKQVHFSRKTIMKTTLLTIAIATFFAACSNNTPADQPTTTQAISTTDTIGLSDFKEWKQKQENLSAQQTFTSEGVNEVGSVTEIEPVAEEKAAPVIIYRDAPVKQPRAAKAPRPANNKVYRAPAPAVETPPIAKAPAPESSGTKRDPYGRGTASTETATGEETTVSTDGDVAVSTPAEVPAKKEGGWSKAAKGGAVGGASGAVLGAVLSKNKAKGAVLGGIVGAAGGYIFGRSQDKKDAKNQ